MSPATQEFIDRGFSYLIDEALDMLGEARLIAGENDVVIVAMLRPDGTGRMYSNTRERVRKLLAREVPEAKNTLARLAEAVPPNRFLLMVCVNADIFVATLDGPSGTQGVLN